MSSLRDKISNMLSVLEDNQVTRAVSMARPYADNQSPFWRLRDRVGNTRQFAIDILKQLNRELENKSEGEVVLSEDFRDAISDLRKIADTLEQPLQEIESYIPKEPSENFAGNRQFISSTFITLVKESRKTADQLDQYVCR